MIIVGAGAVGNALAQIAHSQRIDVVVIEPDRKRAEHCLEKLDVIMINSNIGDPELSESAGFEDTDALIATTTDDAINLMATLMAKEHGIERIISTVNVAEHVTMFEALGVDTLVDPEILVAESLFARLQSKHQSQIEGLQLNGNLMQLDLTERSDLLDQPLRVLKEDGLLQPQACIIYVRRNDEQFFPNGKDSLQANDEILLHTPEALSNRRIKNLTGAK